MNISYSTLIENFAQRVYQITDPLTGAKMPMPLDRIQITPWAYTLTFAALAPAGVATQQLNIQANSDFILVEIGIRANTGAAQTVATAVLPFLRMLLTDSGTNEQLMASPVDVCVYCTIAANGTENTLPYPRLLTGRSSLTVQMSNYAPVAETYSFDVLFTGANCRIYG